MLPLKKAAVKQKPHFFSSSPLLPLSSLPPPSSPSPVFSVPRPLSPVPCLLSPVSCFLSFRSPVSVPYFPVLLFVPLAPLRLCARYLICVNLRNLRIVIRSAGFRFHATASMPFRSTRLRSLAAAGPGFFPPDSQLATDVLLTFK